MVRWSFRLGIVAAVFTVAVVVSGSAYAQGGRGGRGAGGAGGFGGGGFGGGGTTALLMAEDVQKEIDLLPDQLEKIRGLQTSQGEAFREIFGNRDLSQEERTAKMQELTKKNQADIDAVLLPQQAKRLKQIALQERIRNMGAVAALTSEDMGLNVTEEQKTKLGEVNTAAQKELAAKIAKARSEAIAQLLGTLTAEQQAKAKEAIGADFVRAQPQRGAGGRGAGGGAGGAGGRGQRGNRGATPNET